MRIKSGRRVADLRPLYQQFQVRKIDRLVLSFDEWQKDLEALVGDLRVELIVIIIIVRISHHRQPG